MSREDSYLRMRMHASEIQREFALLATGFPVRTILVLIPALTMKSVQNTALEKDPANFGGLGPSNQLFRVTI